MRILGISAFYHDSAAALVEDGRIVAAAQEERFTRKKHDAGFPTHAVEYCLQACPGGLAGVDFVAFYDKPFLKFERLLETYLAFAPRGFTSFSMAMPLWLREKLFQKSLLKKRLKAYAPSFDWPGRLLFAEHHQSHAASAFFASPFEEAIVLTMDGVGEWATTSVSVGRGHHLEMRKEIHFPHSLGLLYSAFTYYTGFKVNSELIDLKPDGSFRLNLSYFDYCTGLRMTNRKFEQLFEGPPRQADELLTQRHLDLAASIQAVTEEVVLRLTRALAAETGAENLCLAGGVALNCVANGKVLRDGRFKRVWIQPAAGDAGGALGAALCAYHVFQNRPRRHSTSLDAMQGGYLGPSFSQPEVEASLAGLGARFSTVRERQLIEATVDALAAGKAVGWFQGRMEFGPRALGARSILGDPRCPTMQSALNLKVKHRESFRPFAPSVLREDVADWFELDGDSPYMLLVADVATRLRLTWTIRLGSRQFTGGRIPAITRSSRPSRNARAARSLSIPASTFAASPSCARRRTPFAVSWERTSRCSSPKIASSGKKTRIHGGGGTTTLRSPLTDSVLPNARG